MIDETKQNFNQLCDALFKVLDTDSCLKLRVILEDSLPEEVQADFRSMGLGKFLQRFITLTKR